MANTIWNSTGGLSITGSSSIGYTCPSSGNIPCCCGAYTCQWPTAYEIMGYTLPISNVSGEATCTLAEYGVTVTGTGGYNLFFEINAGTLGGLYQYFTAQCDISITGAGTGQYESLAWLPGRSLQLLASTGTTGSGPWPSTITPAGSGTEDAIDCADCGDFVCIEFIIIATTTISASGGPSFGPGRAEISLWTQLSSDEGTFNRCLPGLVTTPGCCYQSDPVFPQWIYSAGQLQFGSWGGGDGGLSGTFTAAFTWDVTLTCTGVTVLQDGLFVVPQFSPGY